MAFFRRELGLAAPAVLADIGSGTGKLTRMLLETGYTVHGIEPNEAMRRAAEIDLEGFPGFVSRDGSAEATGLGPASLDAVVAAQAFHWFRIDETRREFSRVLKPRAPVVLIWNRRTEGSPFLRAYEDLLQRLGTDYGAVDHRKTTDSGVLADLYDDTGYRKKTYPHEQGLDWPALEGRALSSSYFPLPGKPNHEKMIDGLRRIFDTYERGGSVRFEYETEVFWGSLDPVNPR